MGVPVGIPSYSNLYTIDEHGNVWSNRKRKFITQRISNCGYKIVQLWREGKCKSITVHRLMALTFLPNPNQLPCVNHKDENKLNNNVENLEWCTYQYNINYGGCIERIKKSNQKNYCSEKRKEIARTNGAKTSKKVKQFTKEGSFIAEYPSAKEASRQTKLNHSHILECCNGKRYKTVGGYIWKFTERV